ncbi:MAG: rod shape-determining protein MreD [Ignavibacteriales bacterium]|nr:rod shape-determining protein MreD [Ignavibacteriales bacterium]
MNIQYLKPILFFIPLAVIQLVIVPLISISNIAPNLVFILITYFTLRHGQTYGTILGFILGFLFDIISGGLIGAFMFSFTLSAFVVGYFYSDNKIDINISTYFFLFILFVCGSINSFLYAVISNSNSSISLFFMMLEEGILPGLYTALFGLPIVIFHPKEGI